MSLIASSTTINLQASLTETGRKYLFGTDALNKQIRIVNGVDNFNPQVFSIYDTDTNYHCTARLSSGDIPNNKGLSYNTILSTCSDSDRKNFIINAKGFLPNISFDSSEYNINETVGNKITITFGLKQKFNIPQSSVSFLIYIDPSATNYTGATIDGFSAITYQNISYLGKIVQISNDQINFSVGLTILSGGTMTAEQSKNIYLNLLPISNCNVGLIPTTNIQVIGSIIPIKRISYVPLVTNAINNITASTVYNYININLNSVEFKNIRRADMTIKIDSGLGPLRSSPLSIELLSPVSGGYREIYSKNDISTFLESGRNIPLFFDIGSKILTIRITQPHLNITSLQNIYFGFANLNQTILDSVNNQASDYRINV